MALVSRICFLTGRICSESTFIKNSYFPFHHTCSFKLLWGLSTKSSGFHFYRGLQSSNDGLKPTEATKAEKQSNASRLKQAVRDYGVTIIVFHVAISLTSLGICYLAISNGVDAMSLLRRLGLPDSIVSSKAAVGGSTFVMAYAVHKVFAPGRIAITLAAAPLLVRYLRRINLLKPPKQRP